MHIDYQTDLLLVRKARRVTDATLFLTASPYRIAVNGAPLVVPAMFSTDLASVPPVPGFRALVPVTTCAEGAVVHDYLYRTHTGTRAAADRIFLQIMEDCRVGWIRRNLAWIAVRIGGVFTW